MIPNITRKMDSQLGAPFLFSQNIGVAAIVAIKIESKKGTIRSWAVLMPAIMMSSAASWINPTVNLLLTLSISNYLLEWSTICKTRYFISSAFDSCLIIRSECVSISLWNFAEDFAPGINNKRMTVGGSVFAMLAVLCRRNDIGLIFYRSCAKQMMPMHFASGFGECWRDRDCCTTHVRQFLKYDLLLRENFSI